MTINIIHLPERNDRLILLQKELERQNIEACKIWEGVKNDKRPFKGIANAHKKIVEHAKKNKFPFIIIGEDDIKFTAVGAYKFFIKNIPKDYDIYLSGIPYGKIKPDNTVNDFSGLTLYIMHERFYDAFLALPEYTHIDGALKNKGRFIVCNPIIAVQHNGYSDNFKRDFNYEYYIKSRKLFGIHSQ